jgi:hypothetical protein
MKNCLGKAEDGLFHGKLPGGRLGNVMATVQMPPKHLVTRNLQ